MATFELGTMGLGASDGVEYDSAKIRKGLTAFDVVHGVSPLAVRGGKIPAGGTPLKVNDLGTAQVQVKAGQAVITPNAAGTAPYPFTLESDVNLDVSAAHASLVRVDLVVIEVQDVGDNTSLCRVYILEGTAGSGRPDLPITPTNTHAMSIATITLPAGGGSTILSAWITQVQSDTWAKTDSDATWTCAPGGTVLIDFASPSSLLQMSATRRQGFAALFAPGTRFVDTVNRIEGYMDGSDIVPTTPRLIHNGYDAGPSAAFSSATTVRIATAHPAFTLVGGTRRLKIEADGYVQASSFSSAMSIRVALTGVTGSYVQFPIVADSVDGRTNFCRQWTVTTSGTVASATYDLRALKETGGTACVALQVALRIWDMGPA